MGESNDDVLTELYWSALSRPPSARERSGILARLGEDRAADSAARRRSLEDLAWAVLTSTEFLFAH